MRRLHRLLTIPPPASGDALYANVQGLLSMNGSPDDAKGKVWTSYGAPTFNGAPKFGSASLQSAGAGGAVASTHASFISGTTPAVMEGWATFISGAGNQVLFGLGSGANYLVVYVDAGNNLLLANVSGQTAGPVLTPGGYFHVAMQYDPVGFYKHSLWIDGGLVAGFQAPGVNITVGDVGFGVGPWDLANNRWRGLLDECRVTIGVTRYVSNQNFTPPTSPYPRS